MLAFFRRSLAPNRNAVSKPPLDARPPDRPGPKVFCIGLNKTGTTSLDRALKDLGYLMGHQPTAELLLEPWSRRDFGPIIEFAKSADAFQDIPFSLPFTYQALDGAFPDARFLLTVRADAEEWYRSLTRFHAKLWTDGERIPTEQDLRKAFYREEGYVWRASRLIYDTPDSDPYHKPWLLAHYERHLVNVREYFRHRPGKLLEINLANDEDYLRMCAFLGKTPCGDTFPLLNKT
jgi:hypothetical protein